MWGGEEDREADLLKITSLEVWGALTHNIKRHSEPKIQNYFGIFYVCLRETIPT